MKKTYRILAGLMVLFVAGTALAGCKDLSGGTDPPAAQARGTGTTAPTKAGACPPAGKLTGSVLPSLDAHAYTTVENPCLAYVGLADQVLGMIPASHPGRDIDEFVDSLGRFTNRLSQVNDVAECGYETDRLAVRIYQSKKNRWAVGVVAVIRGRLGAVADTAVCFLLKQIPLLDVSLRNGGPGEDHAAFCFDTGRDTRNDEGYTVVWMGSSIIMCNTLQDRLVPGGGRLVAVKDGAGAVLRSGPSASDRTVRPVAPGTLGRATCYRAVSDSSEVWVRAEFLGSTGFVPADSLDGLIVRADLKPC
jgi:hypothetical protein